jgi:hypothetical protein
MREHGVSLERCVGGMSLKGVHPLCTRFRDVPALQWCGTEAHAGNASSKNWNTGLRSKGNDNKKGRFKGKFGTKIGSV